MPNFIAKAPAPLGLSCGADAARVTAPTPTMPIHHIAASFRPLARFTTPRSGSRNGFSLLHRQFCGLPPIGAVAVPINPCIAPTRRALCRVPAHPAVGQAEEHHRGIMMTFGGCFQMVAKVSLQLRVERTAADIGK